MILRPSFATAIGILLISLSSAKSETTAARQTPAAIAALRERLKAPRNDAPMIAAHRGDWRNHPENSLAAIRSCIGMGIEIVEIDVRLSADGVPVLMHDKTLERMTDGKGKVSQHHSAQLSSLRLKSHDGKLSNETIPTLRQALELCRGKTLIFIDKAEHCLPAVAKVIRETGMDDHVILYIRSRVTQAEFRQTFGPLVGTRVMFIPLIREEEGGGTAYMQDIEKFLNPPAYAIDFAGESFDVAAFTARAAKFEAGVFVCTLWSPVCGGRDDEKALTNPAGTWGWFAKRGVRCMVTDQPLLMKRFIHGG